MRRWILGIALFLALPAPRALAQEPHPLWLWAAGIEGHVVNDTRPSFTLEDFDTWGGGAFLEFRPSVDLAAGINLGRMGLPAQAEERSSSRLDYAVLRATVLFRDEGFTAGFWAGPAFHHLEPGDPSAPTESRLGLAGGITGRVSLSLRTELRVEGGYHYTRTSLPHGPILLSAGLAIRF